MDSTVKLPIDFVEYTSRLLGEDEFGLLSEAIAGASPVSLRLNRMKWRGNDISSSSKVPWAADGFYLDSRPTYTFDPLFHAGAYYVQEASSMFIEHILKTYVDGPVTMLDLCASPGGKSTSSVSVLPHGSVLVSNEINRQRANVLGENMIKWGYPNVVVTNNAPADFSSFENLFDVVLADVPCSGEGMFRKDAQSIEEWSVSNVNMCGERQRSIIEDVWPAIKPGGLLIYSTCTYNTVEDEENIKWIVEELGAEVLDVPVDPEWGISGNMLSESAFPVFRFFPHRTKGEGFFACVMRKCDDGSFSPRSEKKKNKDKRREKNVGRESFPAEMKSWIKDNADYKFICNDGVVFAYPSYCADFMEGLRTKLKVVHAGIVLAASKGKNFQPCHSLAMSNVLADGAFVVAEIGYEDAISYLRTESVVLDSGIPKGYVLLKYKGVPLGFVKNVGGRANNLYPQEWRIRSGYMPENIVCL